MTIHKCLSRLSQCFGGKVTGDQIAEWVDAMDGATEDELNLASSRLIKSSKFMPRPADVWTEIDKIRVERAPVPEPAVEHWQRRSYHCPACQDEGLRTVWHPNAMRGAVRFVHGKLAEDSWRRTVSVCTVKCVCERGQKRRLHKERRFEPATYNGKNYEPGELTFDSSIMVEVDVRQSLSDRIESLLDWARSYRQPKPANYVKAFDDWD